MQQVGNRTHWRMNFLGAMKALAQAGARLPLGVPDPVLCGASAVELYTGGLWPAADLEVLAADTRLLTAELFAVGFRWSDRPRHTARGLWHPELEIGIDIIESLAVPSVAERSNRLIVAIDIERSRPADVVSLKVVGIEDLLLSGRDAGSWTDHRQEKPLPVCRSCWEWAGRASVARFAWAICSAASLGRPMGKSSFRRWGRKGRGRICEHREPAA
jgi:hypothetical protein